VIALTPAEVAHRDLLARWRGAMDLVGPGPLDPHFEDAARAVDALPSPAGRWADLGSGAGFPGVALAARHPQLTVELVESRRKRAAFLKRAITAGDLTNARVICARSETLPDGAYQGVISRAYRPPPDYLADARRLLAPGGIAALMLAQGEPPVAEGLTLFHVEHYAIGDRARRLAVYRRG